MVWPRMTSKVHLAEIFTFLLLIVESSSGGESSECKACKMTKAHKMKATDCYRKDLRQFPKCLSSDSEVLELSANRIRKIMRADLGKFSYLKILYLSDNLLVKLDDDLFEDLIELQVLDLSLNAISNLPSSVFQLPSLQKLYLSQNWNINIVDAVEASRPIKSPLAHLDISQTNYEDDPQEFPDFGILPYLVVLNISLNRFALLNPRQFMGFCKLQTLGSANVTAYFENPCDCWGINDWMKSKGIQFTPISCSVLRTYCRNLTYNPEDIKLWDDCQKMVQAIEKKNLLGKIYLGVGIALIIILLIVGFICFRRMRNKKSNKKDKNDVPSPAGISLLDKPNKSVPNEYTM